MKRSFVRKTTPAHSLADKITIVEQWQKLQFTAAARGETIQEQLKAAETETILVPLPAEFIAVVRQMLASRSIPASALPACLANALLTADISESSALVDGHAFPNRRKAHAAAMKTFVAQHWRATLALRYHCRGRIESELFRNPFLNRNAA
jgi:hypothetical protein